MSNKPENPLEKEMREDAGRYATPGDPLKDESLQRKGSMNPGPEEAGEEPSLPFSENAGHWGTPGNPLEHENLQHKGSMNPGPEEDAEGHIEK